MSLAPEKQSTNTPLFVWRTLIRYIFPTVKICLIIRTIKPCGIIRDFD
jgi:hypothetical protein